MNTTTSLRWIADRLTHRHPHALMTDEARRATALTAALTAHPNDDTAAEQMERALLHRMPHTDRPITRGEYALILHKTSWNA